MPTPDSWHEEAKKILERERLSSSKSVPPFSDRTDSEIFKDVYKGIVSAYEEERDVDASR